MDFLLLFCLFLVSCLRPSCGSLQNNLTMPDMDLDFSGLNSDESESELSSQLQEIDERSNGWSAWSPWSACSRSCDGGVIHQLRTCRNGPCRGDHVRFKICNMQAVFTFVACLAVANASWFHHEPSAKIIQGPSSRTTLVGPEGSVISAVAPGGQIVHEEHPGVIAHAAPVHSHIVAHQVPVVTHHAPVVAHAVPVVAHHAPTTVVAHHTGVHGHENAIIAGPSGTVTRGHGVAPVLAHHAPVVAPVVLGHDLYHHGHEGQYVHDHSESLYDDGSYKPHYYH